MAPSGLIVLMQYLDWLGYVVAVILRKRNEALLAALEERSYNLPVNVLRGRKKVRIKLHFVNGIKNGILKLICWYWKQSVWSEFTSFMKAKQAIDLISKVESIDRRRYQGDSQKPLSDLESRNKRITWFHADMFEELQVTSDPDRYGSALPEVKNKLEIFNHRVLTICKQRSTSGDPVEAAEKSLIQLKIMCGLKTNLSNGRCPKLSLLFKQNFW